MATFKDYTPAGVIPAAILAFNEDFDIDEAETRRHLSFVAATEGISAVTVNGHSSEIHACSFDEQRQILDVAMDEIGDAVPLINGVYADGSHEAAKIAKMAEAYCVPMALRAVGVVVSSDINHALRHAFRPHR